MVIRPPLGKKMASSEPDSFLKSPPLAQVMDMKQADYRHRIPEDKDAAYVEKTIRRFNLFTDPTLRQQMYPVPEKVRLQIYDGISRDGGGRRKYLTVSNNICVCVCVCVCMCVCVCVCVCVWKSCGAQ